MNRSPKFGGEFFSTIRLAYSGINHNILRGLLENTECICPNWANRPLEIFAIG
jgi:hypothetical protein